MFHNKLIVFALLLLMSCSVIQAAQINTNADLSAPDDVEKKTTTTTTTTTTTPPPTTTTTTAAPTTSTTTAKTTTAPPDTTTTTSTTAPPDTTTTTPKTTIAPPTTTTLPPPTPAPTPYPEPSIGQWNSSCILVKMATQLNISYETKDNKNSTALYNIPTNAIYYDGQCNSNVTQTIQLNWGPLEAQNTMLLEFDLKNQTTRLTKLHFVIAIVGERFPNATENQTIALTHLGNDFGVPMKMSYHCTRPQSFNLTEAIVMEENEKEIIGTVTVHDVQIEAFRSSSNSTAFSEARDCDSAETPDIVPIAVGIALVAMIMIILVSYLCARRRSTSRGYMSF